MLSVNDTNISWLINKSYQRLVALEILAVFFTSLAVSVLRFDRPLLNTLISFPGFPKVLIYPVIWYYFLYRTYCWDRSIVLMSNDLYTRTLKAGWQSFLAFSALAYLLDYPISRIWVAANAVAITSVLLIIRLAFRWNTAIDAGDSNRLKYLYVGKSEGQDSSMKDFQSAYGFSPKVIQINPPTSANSDQWLEQVSKMAFEENIYGLIVGVGEIQDAGILRQLSDLNRNQIIDFVIATKIGAISNRFESLESPILMRVRESSLVTGGAVVKRLFDITFSLLALILLSPLLLILSLLVKVTSPGPVFFVDNRVGKDGRLFRLLKFRSMYDGAEKDRSKFLWGTEEELLELYRSDPRITKFGRFMRRWSLDELPQFWCVFTGSMSIVGPRPVLLEELERIPSNFQIRFLAKPGLTGLWQVTGRKDVPWRDRMVRDIAYIDNWSLSNDLFLIWRTVGVIISGKGSH